MEPELTAYSLTSLTLLDYDDNGFDVGDRAVFSASTHTLKGPELASILHPPSKRYFLEGQLAPVFAGFACVLSEDGELECNNPLSSFVCPWVDNEVPGEVANMRCSTQTWRHEVTPSNLYSLPDETNCFWDEICFEEWWRWSSVSVRPNRETTDLSVALQPGYASSVPVCEMWLWGAICVHKTRHNAAMGGPESISLVHLDVLPATIDDFVNWTVITALDADRDGLDDGEDPAVGNPDADGDTLPDGFEVTIGTSPLVADTDGDGLSDAEEVRLGTEPGEADSDDDGLADGEETEGWAIEFDYYATTFATHVTSDPLVRDSDGDGLQDADERALIGAGGMPYLNPRSRDTNGDGYLDGLNTPPVDLVVAAVPQSGPEGADFSLDGSFVDVDSGDTHVVSVDWGDTTAPDSIALVSDTRAFSVTHAYRDDGMYPVSVTVADAGGLSTEATTTIGVDNVAPTVSNLVGDEVTEGSRARLSGLLHDAGVDDSFTVSVDWQDGSVPDEVAYPAGTTSFTFEHWYLDDDPSGTPSDTYFATVTVTDDDGGMTTETVATVVNNAAPTVWIDTIAHGHPFMPVGVDIEVVAGWGDNGVEDTHTGSIDWGDGTISALGDVAAGIVGVHAYGAAGVYVVRVTVTDDDGGTATEAVQIEIRSSADMASGIAHQLFALVDEADPTSRPAIQDAIDSLIGNNRGKASNGATDKFKAGALVAALGKLAQAANHLKSQTTVDVTAQLDLLALTAQAAAEREAAAALEAAGCVDPTAATCSKHERKKFAVIDALLTAGRSALNAGDYVHAIDAFKAAIQRS